MPRPGSVALALCLSLLVSACSAIAPARPRREAGELVRVAVVAFNDLHGHVDPARVRVGTGASAPFVRLGGLAVLAAYVDAVRAANPNRTLLLDAGDDYQGTLLSDHFEGRSTLAGLNALGIDAAALGDHDLAYGPLRGAPAGGDPLGRIRMLARQAAFPYLAANVVQGSSASRPPFDGEGPELEGSKLFELDGVSVGVVGATTAATPAVQRPERLAGLGFRRLADAVPAEAARLRRAGASAVVLLVHAGGRCDMRLPAELGDVACEAPVEDEVRAFLESVPAGTVDAVVAGHVHAEQAHVVRGVPVVQTSGGGRSLSRIDLWIDPEAPADAPALRRVPRVTVHRPLPLCHAVFGEEGTCDAEELAAGVPALGSPRRPVYEGRAIVAKPSVRAALRPFRDEVRAAGSAPVAELPEALDFDRFRESPAANCVADAAKEAAEARIGRRIDAAVLHSGRVAAGMPQGVLDVRHLHEVLPFDDHVVLADLSGEELDALGREVTETPDRVAVVSAPWQAAVADPPRYPRHRGFIARGGRGLEPGRVYRVLVDEHLAGTLDAAFEKAAAEKRLRPLSVTLRGLVAERLGDEEAKLPESCREPVRGRTLAVRD